MSHTKLIDADAAARLIRDGDSVAVTGNGAGMVSGEAILASIEDRFLRTGHPRDLTVVHSLGIGDRHTLGINRLAHEGLVRRVIAGHFTWSPRMQQLIREEKVEAYSFPAGALQLLLREIGAGRPGLITETGLGTFVDPRQDGGACNARSRDELVVLLTVGGKEHLRYKPFRVDVAIVRGTYADPRGNISPEEEPIDLDLHSVALAAHNSGGLVLAQVRQLVEAGRLNPRSIRIPGILVDHIVEAPEQEQFYGRGYDPTVTGSQRALLDGTAPELPSRLDRRIIARRAALELRGGVSLNFGFGIPGGNFGIIAEEGTGHELWLSVEQGVHNGRMLDDALFGAARNPEVIVPSVEQFDFYSGGGIDIAFLGMGEVDAAGNVNVSHLGGTLIGPGGFMDISQNAKKVVFCGTFDAQGGHVEFVKGKLRVVQQGRVRKIVPKVERITFSGEFARLRGREVLYVTERAVFRLEERGLTLIEVAPGLDLEDDVLRYLDFRPQVGEVTVMPIEVFL